MWNVVKKKKKKNTKNHLKDFCKNASEKQVTWNSASLQIQDKNV